MELSPETLRTFILLIFLCFGAGTVMPMVLGFVLKRKDTLTSVSLGLALTGAAVILWLAVLSWTQTSVENPGCRITYPLTQLVSEEVDLNFEIAFSFYTDKLAAFFLLLIGIFTVAVVLHLFSWLENIHDRHRIAAVFNLFVASIALTILSDTVYSFLFFQESMTLAFAYLALFRHNTYLEREGISAKDLEASKTAFKSYLIFEHVGIMLIVIALLIMSSAVTSFEFQSFRDLQKSFESVPKSNLIANPLIGSLVFLFALAGFGIKAGIFPNHVWVPMVHPFSPTSIHAMMSGVALKAAGLYGMYRTFFFFMPPNFLQWWWGWLVMLLAGLTALFGVFYAILGKDLKSALASHSVENVGIILAGIGLALVFAALKYSGDNPFCFADLSRLAMIASLYHLVNHSIFKGLLFFCTGAIENRLGTVSLGRMGGLMRRYPLTASTFLIGSVSIAGFPPFNGFVSEWLLLQTTFAGMDVYSTPERIVLLLGMVFLLFCLALAFSLTALAFVKIAGETLLGTPRDPYIADRARSGEAPWPMRIVMITFAVLCLLFGLLPSTVIQHLDQLAANILQETSTHQTFKEADSLVIGLKMSSEKSVPGESGAKDVIPLQFSLSNRMVFTLGAILAVAILTSLLAGSRVLRSRQVLAVGPPWMCGVPFINRLMQYTGASFASLIWKPFESEHLPSEPGLPAAREQEIKESLPYREYVTNNRFVSEITRKIYNNLLNWLLRICDRLGVKTQPGDIRVYLQYIFILFICILLYLLSMARGAQ
jgi:hydrogenase-4 component B